MDQSLEAEIKEVEEDGDEEAHKGEEQGAAEPKSFSRIPTPALRVRIPRTCFRTAVLIMVLHLIMQRYVESKLAPAGFPKLLQVCANPRVISRYMVYRQPKHTVPLPYLCRHVLVAWRSRLGRCYTSQPVGFMR